MERNSSRAVPLTEGVSADHALPWRSAWEIPYHGAVSDGRVRRAAVSIFDAVQRAAAAAGWVRAADLLSRRLRDERGLHSAERRYVADALHRMVRGWRRLVHLSGLSQPGALQVYLTWLADLDAEHPGAPEQRAALLVELQQAGLSHEAIAERVAALAAPIPAQLLGVALSYPDWLVSALLGEQDCATVTAVLEAQNRRAPLTVRVNRLKGTREELQGLLMQEGIATTPTPLSPFGLVLHTRVNVYGLARFRDGWMELQDEGSQLVAELLAPPPGSCVVDACAGAGGKTLALGALLENKGRLVALDVDGRKLDELRLRARRAGLTNCRAVLIPPQGMSGLPSGTVPLGGAARVLVDAPCTGLGVLRRNPEARWRLGPQDLTELPQKQRAILAESASLVAPHGRLIYATCSILRRENDDVVDAFLADHPGFVEVPVKEILGGARAAQVGDGQRLRLLPGCGAGGASIDGGPDGFFAAVLRRQR